jgi:hypothetical protein
MEELFKNAKEIMKTTDPEVTLGSSQQVLDN